MRKRSVMQGECVITHRLRADAAEHAAALHPLRFLIFAVILVYSLCQRSPSFRAYAADAPAVFHTERQREILHDLASLRPPGAPEQGEWMLTVWDSDVGLADIVSLPYGSENAASRFKLLEDLYPSEKAALELDGADTRGVAALLEAADMGSCRLMPDYYPVFDNAETKQPDFQVLRLYLQALLRRAERATAAGDVRDAERCYRAALVCGRHLTQDKASSLVFVTGLVYKVRGAQGYANFLVRAGDPIKAEAVRNYATYLGHVMRAFVWKANVAMGEFDGFACLPAVIRIALEDVEPFWRKEAVIRLATLRYGVPDAAGLVVARHPGFEQAADAALARVASGDADASVRRMAVWAALAVSPANYASLEHRFSVE
ncbi:MAG: hypothetical protein LUC93_18975 [Planctomycetaceae bacterium]|nr:hypothetical protein [Planctomycetaceae bacterium]